MGSENQQKIVWDNTNIAESYPGITFPLTFSFIRHAYANVYAHFLRSIGVSQKRVLDAASIYENLLGHIHGHVYYNVHNWYRLISFLPGYRYNKDFLEAMWNPARKLQKNKQKKSFWQTIKLIPLASFFLSKILLAGSAVKRFVKDFKVKYERFSSEDLSSYTINDLVRRQKNIEESFFNAWAVPILNDFRVMIFHGMLKKIIFSLVGKDGEHILPTLLTKHLELASIEPILALKKISDAMNASGLDSNVKSRDILWKEITTKGEYLALKEALLEYINKFGHRNPSELKLESPTMDEDPKMVLDLLKLYSKDTKRITLQSKDNDEIMVLQFLRWTFKKRYPVKYIFLWPFVCWIHKIAKRAIAAREEMRLLRSLGFGLVRRNFLEIGNKFAHGGIIYQQRDIFFLKREEVLSYEENVIHDFRKIIQGRKSIFEQYGKEETPGRRIVTLATDFEVYAPEQPEEVNTEMRLLRGIGGSAGIVRGTVICMKVFDSSTDVKGKILVTQQTDPGWTLIFPLITGIVTERGNILSHAAIVSRELGIPGVLAVDRATDLLKNGMHVELNGSTGTVTIL